jgi:ABC-type amino acid transport substrate-binding protein
MAEAMRTNQIAAAIGDAPVLEYYVYSHPTEPLDVVGPVFQPDKYGFGLPRNSALRPALNVQILGAKESGLLADIHDRYFGEDPT